MSLPWSEDAAGDVGFIVAVPGEVCGCGGGRGVTLAWRRIQSRPKILGLGLGLRVRWPCCVCALVQHWSGFAPAIAVSLTPPPAFRALTLSVSVSLPEPAALTPNPTPHRLPPPNTKISCCPTCGRALCAGQVMKPSYTARLEMFYSSLFGIPLPLSPTRSGVSSVSL